MAVAAKFEHQDRVGQVLKGEDMFGTTQTVMGGGRYNLTSNFRQQKAAASKSGMTVRKNFSKEYTQIRAPKKKRRLPKAVGAPRQAG